MTVSPWIRRAVNDALGQPRSWDLNDREYRAASGLPAGERDNHIVKRVADWHGRRRAGAMSCPVAVEIHDRVD